MYIVCVILMGLILAAVFTGIRKQEYIKSFSKKDAPLRILYPLAAAVISFCKRLGVKKAFMNREEIRALYPQEPVEQAAERQNLKCCASVLAVVAAALLLVLLYMSSKEEKLIRNNSLIRPESGEGDEEVGLIVESEELTGEQPFNITVSEYRLTGEKKERLFAEACSYIEKKVIGENASPTQISMPLNLISRIPKTSIEIEWKELDHRYISSAGTVKNEEITDNVTIELTAELTYCGEKRQHCFPITIQPVQETEEEKFLRELSNEVERIDKETSSDKLFILPEIVAGKTVDWQERSDYTWFMLLAAGIAAACVAAAGMKQEQKKDMKKRREQMMRDYPEIVSKFTILLTSGMTIKGTWERIVEDYYTRSKLYPSEKFNYAYTEMQITQSEMHMGVPEITAYERFGRRCGIPAYQKFSTILVRNLKRGSKSIIPLLEMESSEAFIERKEHVKQLGEEAGTKLLGPMIGMFCIVLAIVIVPAFSTML